jgi:hypothetical protein
MEESDMRRIATVLSLLTIAMLTACATQPAAPETTYDGLTQVPSKKFDNIYRLPGADLSEYSEFGLAPCTVAFRKNWLRDQNRSRLDLSSRVRQEDVDRIKDALAEDCDRYFREALQEAPPYALTDDFEDGQAVLVIKPGIIDLDVAAPDVRGSAMTRTYTTSAGEMTLSLELVDGTTGQVLVRVVDRQEDRDTYRLEWTNSVSNRADARLVLRRWSERLREGLDAAMSGD